MSNKRQQRRKRPTQADVAKMAGVSQAVVSYVLNEAENVSISEDTQKRIWQAVKTLGYVPNNSARSLRTNRTYTIATIIPDITNPFYPLFERGVQDVAGQNGYDLIVYNTDGVREKEQQALQSVRRADADGLIGVFFHLSASDLTPLLAHDTAVVRLEAMVREPGPSPLDSLFVDNVAAARDGVLYLLELGYRCIGMLAGRIGPGPFRVQGYKEAFAEGEVPVDEHLIRGCDFTEEGGYHGMHGLLRSEPDLEAVFVTGDTMALGALAAIQETGRTIPGDIAVMGFDDIPTASLLNPPLTTISQFPHQLGRRAAEMIFQRIAGMASEKGICEEMPYQLIVRQSA